MPKELAQLQFEIIILVHIKNQHEKVSLVVRSLWQCQTGINNKKPRPGKQVRLRKSMIAEMPPFAHCTPPCICTLFCRSSYCSRSWLPRHWFLQDLSSYFAIFLHSFTLPETDWRRTSNGPPCRTPGRFDSSRSCWLERRFLWAFVRYTNDAFLHAFMPHLWWKCLEVLVGWSGGIIVFVWCLWRSLSKCFAKIWRFFLRSWSHSFAVGLCSFGFKPNASLCAALRFVKLVKLVKLLTSQTSQTCF